MSLLSRVRSGTPDFQVHQNEVVYLNRWYVIPQNRFFNIYLHNFLHDDDDRALHDHPWHSLSIGLKGIYMELIKKPYGYFVAYRLPFLPVFRRARHTHRIILLKDKEGKSEPAWTLFITLWKIREWGFHCPKGWRHWKAFCDERDAGQVGRGCAD